MNKSAATVALMGVALVIGCNEQRKTTYDTAASAAKDGAFDRGWLPDVLLPDASDISEDHDLDSNRGEARFQPTAQLEVRVKQQCSRLPREEAPPGPFHLQSQPGIDQYKCGEFMLALDMGHKRGYMWH